jgi:hypothetical protein
MLPAAPSMRVCRVLLVALCWAVLAGCAASIAQLNARPDKYYQHKVDIVAQIARRQDLPGVTLLEVADAHGDRILVRTPTSPEAVAGEWVRVRGILVPESRVGDAVVYDVVSADSVERSRRPRLAGLM